MINNQAKPHKKWWVLLVTLMTSLMVFSTINTITIFSNTGTVYASNSKKKSSDKKSTPKNPTPVTTGNGTTPDPSQSTSNNSSSGASTGTSQDPWTDAAKSMAKKYDVDSGKEPDDLKGHDNLGNIYSYLGPDSQAFTDLGKHSYVCNFSANGKDDSSKQGEANKAFAFGSALYITGLDHPFQSSKVIGMTKFGRSIGGLLFSAVYTMVMAVTKVFSTIIQFLPYFDVCDWIAGTNIATNGPFGDLARTVRGAVQAMQAAGVVWWTFCLGALLLLGAMGFRFAGGNLAGNTHVEGAHFIFDEIMHYAFRAFYILLMPLLLATVMDQILQSCGSTYQQDTMATTTAPVYSALVDFKGAVQHSRIELPSSIKLKVSYSGNEPDLSSNQISDWNAYTAGDSSARDAKTSTNNYNDIESGSGDVEACYHLISEWEHCEVYYPSTFASFIDGHSKKSPKSGDDITKNKSYTMNGSLSAGDLGSTYSTASPAKDSSLLSPTSKGGLSTLGMFNYLATTFDTSSATYQVDADDETTYDDIGHYDVGLAGRGTSAVANFTLTLAELICIAIFGMYTLFMAISALFTGGVKEIGYGVLAAGGGLQAIVKFVAACMMMVVEFVGTSFFYIIGIHFLLGAAQLLPTLFGVNGMIVDKLPFVVQASSFVSLQAGLKLLTALGLFWLTFQIMRLRGYLIKGANEMTENGVRSIIGSPDRHFAHNASMETREAENGHTYDRNGNDDFKKVIHDSNDARGGYNGINGKNGRDGHADIIGAGSYRQSPKNRNPHGPLAQFSNMKQGFRDAVKAAEAKKGAPLTSKEKRSLAIKYARQQAGNSLYRGLAHGLDAIGSHGLARVSRHHAENRDAKQQIERMNAIHEGQQRAEKGEIKKEHSVEKKLAKTEGEIGKDVFESTKNLADMRQEVDASTAELANDLNKDASELQEATGSELANAMNNTMSDSFNSVARDGGSLSDISRDVAEKRELMDQAESELQAIKDAPLTEGETQEMRQAKIDNKQQAYDNAKAAFNKSQRSASVAASLMPVDNSLLANPKDKMTYAEANGYSTLQNAKKNVQDAYRSASFAQKQAEESGNRSDYQKATNRTQAATQQLIKTLDAEHQQLAPSVGEASNALHQVALARSRINEFVEETQNDPDGGRISFKQFTKPQQKVFNNLVAQEKAAEKHAASIGLAKETYDTSNHILEAQQRLNANVEAVTNGKDFAEIEHAHDYHFTGGELRDALAHHAYQSVNHAGNNTYKQISVNDTTAGKVNNMTNNVASKINDLKDNFTSDKPIFKNNGSHFTNNKSKNK